MSAHLPLRCIYLFVRHFWVPWRSFVSSIQYSKEVFELSSIFKSLWKIRVERKTTSQHIIEKPSLKVSNL